MEIKLDLQEIVLLQKIRQGKLTLIDHKARPTILSEMYHAGLYRIENRSAIITELGRRVLEKHLPVMSVTVAVPQSFNKRRR